MKRWAIPAAIIVAIEYLFAFAIGARVGFQYRIPFETYAVLGATVAVLGATLIIGTKLARYAMEGEVAPTERLLHEAPYIWSFAAGALLSALQIAVLTWTKVMLPIASPFWADPLLANFDHLLFGGEPWRIAEAAFGWAAPAFDRAYVMWAPLKFGTFVILILMPEDARKSRALIAYFLMMATVAIGQFLLSSGGPVFYHRLGFGPRFEAIPMEPWVRAARDYLWAGYVQRGGEIGGGISAMPSLHVAASLWIALAWRSYSRVLGYLGLMYFATILVGSVLLGWHYAADGIAGGAITAVAWFAAARVMRTREPAGGELAIPALSGH